MSENQTKTLEKDSPPKKQQSASFVCRKFAHSKRSSCQNTVGQKPFFTQPRVVKGEGMAQKKLLKKNKTPQTYFRDSSSLSETESNFRKLRRKKKVLHRDRNIKQFTARHTSQTDPLKFDFEEKLGDLEEKFQKKELKIIEKFFHLISYSNNFSKYDGLLLQVFHKMKAFYSPLQKPQTARLSRKHSEIEQKDQFQQILESFQKQGLEMLELRNQVMSLNQKINNKDEEIGEIKNDLEHYQEKYQEQREWN